MTISSSGVNSTTLTNFIQFFQYIIIYLSGIIMFPKICGVWVVKRYIKLEERVVKTMYVEIELTDEQAEWVENKTKELVANAANKPDPAEDMAGWIKFVDAPPASLYVEMAWKLAEMDHAPAWDEDTLELNNEECGLPVLGAYKPSSRAVDMALDLVKKEYEGGEDTWLSDRNEPKE